MRLVLQEGDMRIFTIRGCLDAKRFTKSTTPQSLTPQSLYEPLLTVSPYSKRQDVQTRTINAASHSAFGDNSLPTLIMPHGFYRSDTRRRAPTPPSSPSSRPWTTS